MSHHLFKTDDGKDYTLTFTLITTLFLLWGFCNGMMEVLDKHFQNTLHITKAQSALVQFANFGGYFLMALPAGWLARRFGYKRSILIGLGLIATGAFWFIPATTIGTYWAFLTGLFILASGLTCLETVANPYTTVLGPDQTGPARINLAQSCNSIGTIFGPIVGGQIIFSSAEGASTTNETLYIPYLGIGLVVALLAIVFFFANLPEVQAEDDYHLAATGPHSLQSLWSHHHFTLAVAAQFFYVAAQVGIFSFFINYIHTDTPPIAASIASLLPAKWTTLKDGVPHITELGASQLLAYVGFVLFFLGRFTGSMLLRYFRAHLTLGVFAVASSLLMLLVVLHLGWISGVALFLSFYFMSIMFPTIFALGIHGLGEQTKRASSFIVMSIVGGALMPILMGWIADRTTMTFGFIVPLGCFVFIAVYALSWSKLSKSEGLLGVSTARGH